MNRLISIINLITISFLPLSITLTYANPESGVNILETDLSPILKKSPNIDDTSSLYGARFGLGNYFYNKPTLYGQLELGIDASLLYLKTSQKNPNQNFSDSITIISPAFTARWYPVKWQSLALFTQLGVGPSYMSNNNFEGRKLGKRFVFQDIASLGIKTINLHHNNYNKNEFLLGIYIIHYSNAGLDKNNRGITLPVSARVGYRF